MTRDDFNRNSRIVSAILDPFVIPEHKGTIFYNHHCSVCNDGERPCREGKPNLCGNPRARND